MCALAGGGRQRRSKHPSTQRSAGAAFSVPDFGVALPARASFPVETAVKKGRDPMARRQEEKSNDSGDSDGSSDIEESRSKKPRGAVILARFIEKGSLNWLLGSPRPRVTRGEERRASRGETPEIRSQLKSLHSWFLLIWWRPQVAPLWDQVARQRLQERLHPPVEGRQPEQKAKAHRHQATFNPPPLFPASGSTRLGSCLPLPTAQSPPSPVSVSKPPRLCYTPILSYLRLGSAAQL